jgi:SAM-dependent methyltransferase
MKNIEGADPFFRIANFYNDLVNRYGHDPRACDYGHAESQKIKFRVLSEVMNLEEKQVLDVGCGFADFVRYLRERFDAFHYVGIDICPRMIQEARHLEPNIDLRLCNILDGEFEGSFDVVFANGIFYLLGDEAPALMRCIIGRMYEFAQWAVAFNSLSFWAPEKAPGEFYADPLDVLKFCRTLTPWVVLRHDYHPRDFTVYMYKRQIQ